MKDFAKRGMTLGLAVSAALALYSCDGFADAAGQAAGVAADAGRWQQHRSHAFTCKIRGPKGWVDYVFNKSELGELEKDYVLGTDRTAHVEHYWRYTNDNLRKKLEAQGIKITDYHSTSKTGEYCWVEFNLNQITEFTVKWG